MTGCGLKGPTQTNPHFLSHLILHFPLIVPSALLDGPQGLCTYSICLEFCFPGSPMAQSLAYFRTLLHVTLVLRPSLGTLFILPTPPSVQLLLFFFFFAFLISIALITFWHTIHLHLHAYQIYVFTLCHFSVTSPSLPLAAHSKGWGVWCVLFNPVSPAPRRVPDT